MNKAYPKLRLVPRAPPDDAADGAEAPFTDEELGEAALLRDRLAAGTEPLAEGLRTALAPPALTADDHEAILQRALGDEAAAPLAERGAADRLREALGPTALAEREAAGDDAAVGLSRALRLAWQPPPVDAARHEAILERALRAPDRVLPGETTLRGRPGSARGRVVRFVAAAFTGAAMAAGLALFVRSASRAPAPQAAAVAMAVAPAEAPREEAAVLGRTYVRARSTASLFDAEAFHTGRASGRIERIASARAADLRANRFAAWGVR